jgi:glycosyltransferase involved in cell wall biosynthesis
MKILFLTDNFPPEVNAPATRTYEHCIEWIKEKDVEITVITCTPNFPHGKVYAGYKNRLFQTENIDGIKVIRVWSYITENRGFTKRVLDYFSYAVMAFFVGLFQKYDMIIATSPQFFTTWAGWGLSKIQRKPWIFELRDLWPETIKTVGAMKEGKIIEILEKIELALYHSANHVVPVSDAFKTNLVTRGINANKITVVTNGSNNSLFNLREKDEILVKKLNLEEKFVIGYIGTHGMSHGLDFIIQSLTKIKDKKIHFLFIGDGAMKETIVDLAKKLNLENITFLDSIAKNEVPNYLSVCDVSLAPLKNKKNFRTVIPSKIFEAAAMGKPTLLGVKGQAQQILELDGAGLCFEPEDEKDFLEKLEALKDEKIYKECQLGCIQLAKRYDRKNLAKKMLQIIRNVSVVAKNQKPYRNLKQVSP